MKNEWGSASDAASEAAAPVGPKVVQIATRLVSAGGKEGEKDGGADGVQDYDACSTRLQVWVIGAAAAGDEDCGRVCALSELLRSVMAV